MLSCVLLFATPWTVTHQAPLYMQISRQEYWSGWPWPTPGDLPDPGIEPTFLCLLHWQADSLPLSHMGGPQYSSVLCLVTQSCLTLCNPMDYSPPGSSLQGDSVGRNIGVGCHALLQGIFQSQRLNPGLPHYKQILYPLSHQGTPRILEWVAYPFCRGSSQARNWTRVSCISCGFFVSWAIREAPKYSSRYK